MDFVQEKMDSQCKATLKGKFTFSDREVLKPVLQDLTERNIKSLIIDIEGVEFIDSAALGILLLMHDEAEKSNIGLILKKPQGQVKKMFEISRFYDLFTIED